MIGGSLPNSFLYGSRAIPNHCDVVTCSPHLSNDIAALLLTIEDNGFLFAHNRALIIGIPPAIKSPGSFRSFHMNSILVFDELKPHLPSIDRASLNLISTSFHADCFLL